LEKGDLGGFEVFHGKAKAMRSGQQSFQGPESDFWLKADG
jgi:hypothetical protein